MDDLSVCYATGKAYRKGFENENKAKNLAIALLMDLNIKDFDKARQDLLFASLYQGNKSIPYPLQVKDNIQNFQSFISGLLAEKEKKEDK